jgi:hypothetical protein
MRLAPTAAAPLMASGKSFELPEVRMSPIARDSLSSQDPHLIALELLCRLLEADQEWLFAFAKRLEQERARAES